MTVSELNSRMTYREFLHWVSFYRIEAEEAKERAEAGNG